MEKYQLTHTVIKVNEETVNTYGIKFKSESEETTIEDISTDRELVSKIVDDCNTYDLDPVHLIDYIEDNLF